MGWLLEGAIGVCLIIGTSGLVSIILRRSKRIGKGIGPKQADEFNERLNILEKRLTDIQDVMITIDDKLGRMKKSGAEPADESN